MKYRYLTKYRPTQYSIRIFLGSRSEGQHVGTKPNSPHRHLSDKSQTHAAADSLHFERDFKKGLAGGAAVPSSSLSADLHQQHHTAADFPKLNQANQTLAHKVFAQLV